MNINALAPMLVEPDYSCYDCGWFGDEDDVDHECPDDCVSLDICNLKYLHPYACEHANIICPDCGCEL